MDIASSPTKISQSHAGDTRFITAMYCIWIGERCVVQSAKMLTKLPSWQEHRPAVSHCDSVFLVSMCAFGEVTACANVASLCNSICLKKWGLGVLGADTEDQAEVITGPECDEL